MAAENNYGEESNFSEGYGKKSHISTQVDKNILNDLKAFGLPEDITIRADIIYNKMKQRVQRGKIRDQKLFFCAYNAYRELDRDVDPISLGAMFGLTPGEVQKTDSRFSPLQTGYHPPNRATSCIEFIPSYAKSLNLSDELTAKIINFALSLLNKDTSLSHEPPKTMAAGMLKYYMLTNGIALDQPYNIAYITGRSMATIENAYNRISRVDNS